MLNDAKRDHWLYPVNFYPCSRRMVVKNPWIRLAISWGTAGIPGCMPGPYWKQWTTHFVSAILQVRQHTTSTEATYTWYKCGTVYNCMIVCETTTCFHKNQQQSLDFGASQIISPWINFTKLKFHQLNWSLRSGFAFSMVHFQNSFALWFVNINWGQ